MLRSKAKADAGYFASKCGHAVDEAEARAIEAAFLRLTAGQIPPLGRAAPAFRQGAFQADHRKPGPAHSGGARHTAMIQLKLLPPPSRRRRIMVAQTMTAKPIVVNGINLDDLFALIEGVRRDTAKSKTNWRVTTTWQGQTRSRAQVEGFGIG
jgi:hypothetical protein